MRYAVLYGPLTIAAIVLSFFEVFEPIQRDHYTGYFGSLWEIAARPAGEPARLGLLFGAITIVLIWVSVIPKLRTAVIPAIVAAIAASCTLLLIIRPATGDPKPDLTPSGTALLVIAISVTAVAVVQCVDYAQQGRRTRSSHRVERPQQM
ncbi:MAG TPA: hypothetical protein VK095_10020 [Beutenbergiaceae bacterium]|nr:hypothetical protein [Beutenbergiaceae bacterium]